MSTAINYRKHPERLKATALTRVEAARVRGKGLQQELQEGVAEEHRSAPQIKKKKATALTMEWKQQHFMARAYSKSCKKVPQEGVSEHQRVQRDR